MPFYVKTISLKKEKEFKKLYTKGKSIANRQIISIVLKNNLNINRLGIVISKKIGKAVKRNRIRRIFRQCYIDIEDRLKLGYDIILIPRAEVEYDYKKTKLSLVHILKKHNIIN